MRIDLDYEYDDGEYLLEGTACLMDLRKLSYEIPFFVSIDGGESYDLICAADDYVAVCKFFALADTQPWLKATGEHEPPRGQRDDYYRVSRSLFVPRSSVLVEEASWEHLSFKQPLEPETWVTGNQMVHPGMEVKGGDVDDRLRGVPLVIRDNEVVLSFIHPQLTVNTFKQGDLVKWRPLESLGTSSRKTAIGRVLYMVDINSDEEGCTPINLLQGRYFPTSPVAYDGLALVAFIEEGSRVVVDLVPANQLRHYSDAELVLWFLNYNDSHLPLAHLCGAVQVNLDSVAALTDVHGKLYEADAGVTSEQLVSVATEYENVRRKLGVPWTPPGQAAQNKSTANEKTTIRKRAFVDMVQFEVDEEGD